MFFYVAPSLFRFLHNNLCISWEISFVNFIYLFFCFSIVKIPFLYMSVRESYRLYITQYMYTNHIYAIFLWLKNVYIFLRYDMLNKWYVATIQVYANL